jgi:ribonuclease HI
LMVLKGLDSSYGEKSAKNRPNDKGVEAGVDEATTRAYYKKLSQKDAMKAGALHTILADGVWTPRRAHKREKNSNGDCLLCGEKDAGAHHLWWKCIVLNRKTNFGFLKLSQIRKDEENKPECFWNTGVVTNEWTTLPDSKHMLDIDLCHECNGTAKTVFIDGSSYKIGNSNYSGWGLWSPDDVDFRDNGPLKGKNQSSDRAEVRALVAALEKTKGEIDIITDNQYVRNTAQYLESGGAVHKGKHCDLWTRIKQHIHKMKSIRWVKAHLKKENATKAGVCYEDWYGNNEADIQAKAGAAKHGYTENQKNAIK